ncbi:hypothetical protein IFT37_09070 [Pseudomonas fluorescens]|uniref:hypothetical protein n=1 Tax=Pseudomonas fluorescens group TaxID=136843 RepID=UPI00177B5958|nr:hypothetical protein [Pseudomonas fluorescens]MBD8148909.1 hypothetical protein [Pseudomonas fluorescens]MBD8176394.1 hypothetical protein [Pseudomonas fluorescens]MBD8745253.1 hypothetical protein [Pseudomonas fluorescens]MBD8749039.1 hypothetical protein [Pseudomonas fluorescens]MBD8758046.1 hypothetical protein [Pseudomonas fluorescens]
MIAQIMIAALGVVAIWFSQSKRLKVRRYACLFGMAGQPFWFWSSINAGQWGIVLLSCFYTVAWAKGIKTHWIDRKPDEPV